jgi:hypothetical protein
MNDSPRHTYGGVWSSSSERERVLKSCAALTQRQEFLGRSVETTGHRPSQGPIRAKARLDVMQLNTEAGKRSDF